MTNEERIHLYERVVLAVLPTLAAKAARSPSDTIEQTVERAKMISGEANAIANLVIGRREVYAMSISGEGNHEPLKLV